MTKIKSYVYGRDPNPKNWHEASDALKSMQGVKPKRKGNGLMERLATIEAQLKERKG